MFGFFKAVGQAIWNTIQAIGYGTFKVTWSQALSLATLAVGIKGYMTARQMLAKGQDILANKTSAGGKIPVIYGTRRVGAQIIYMDVSANDSRDLYVVYALSVGECDEILGRTIELDGNPLTDSARFRDGGYIGSDKISLGSGSLNTVSQNGTGIDAGAGQFGTSPTSKYRYVMNLHHGAASQTADPMLVASMPNWTSAHRLDGICYIAAHYGYDKEGIWSGVPQLTVQVRGKKVYDPRDSGQTFGTPSTYEWSDNPALCFLDYITNNEYGKGLTESQINMSTFSSAANVCDTQVDQPYFNGTAQSLTWSGNAGDDFITIGGASANLNWWQNKIGEQIYIYDANGDGVIDGADIKEIQRNQFYDSNEEYIVYINDTLGSTYSSQTGSSLLKVKRFHCNGYLDTNKNVMENAKELLANMRGIFLYIDGKYELSIEDTGASTFSINDDHIIADAGISVDYGNKDKKANKVIVEFFNANKKYELDTATVLHDASPEYYSDDGDEILEIKAEFPYISDPYIAYNMGKAILTRSRNQTTMQFLGTPEMYKLNVGDIVDLTYTGLGFSGKVCRVEALELQPNGLVAVSLIEYFDVYTWEVPPQEPVEELANLPSAYAVKAPTGLSFTDTDSSSTGRPFLSWNEPTDFPDYQYRVNVVDSSDNQVLNRIVDVENCDLNFLPVNANYVASVTSLNTLGTESSAATLTFTIGDAPTGTADIQDDAIVTNKILDGNVTNAKINSITANKITAGTIDTARLNVSEIISTGNIIVSGDNVTDLNNNAGYVDTAGAASAAPVQSVAGATGAVSAQTIITAGSIVVQGDNISDLSNDSAFINGGQVNSNVTSISGGVITTGTVNTDRLNVSDIISTGNILTTGTVIANAMNVGSGTFTVSSAGAIAATSGTIGGVTLTSNKLHLGTGTFNNSNTAFYVDTSGQFSLKDKLSFNGADLVINGKVKAPILSASGQAGLYSLIPTSITGGSDDAQPVISADTDTDLGTVILATGDPYNSTLWTSGSPDTDATGLWLGGSGTIYMLGTGKSFRNSPISSGINSLGTSANGWKGLYLHNNTSFSSTSNALYQLNGSLYFNGSAVGGGGGGSGDITSVTAGTNLNGGGTSGDVTVNLDNSISITGTISSGDITASGSSGAVITAEHNGGGLANDAFIGGFIFKNNDTSGTEPHYAGITARAVSTFGAMALEFFADRDDYENDTPALTLSSVGTSGTTNNLSFQNITAITGVTTISSGAITTSGNIQVQKTGADSIVDVLGNSSYDPVLNLRSDQGNITTEGFQIWYDNSVGDVHLHTTYNNDAAAIRFHTRTGTDKATNNERFVIEGNGTITITSALNEALNFSASTTNDARGISFNNRTALTADSSDGYLRLNDNSEFSNGVYTPANFRSDGNVRGASYSVVGTTVIDNSRNLTNIGTISSGAIDSSGTSNFDSIRLTDSSVMGFGTAKAGATVGHTASVDEGIFWHTGSDYGIYRTAGAWSGANYQQLKLRWATGIEIDGNGTTYGKSGINFLNGNIMMDGTQILDASRSLFNINDIRCDGGNLIMGDQAYSISSAYVGMKTSFQSGSRDYMIISGTSDGNTYVSAKDGSATFIRGGGNSSSNQIVVPDGSTITATTSDFRVTGNVTAYASDKRLKTNIKTIKNPIEKIKKIRGVEFNWLDNIEETHQFIPKCKRETGVIAQEIEEVMPDAISPAPFNNEYKTVEKDKIVALLIEAIKDQQKQIDELKARLDNDSSN